MNALPDQIDSDLTLRPWDQQPGEPDSAYSRFLFFRNLGPGRSLAQAYTGWKKVTKGTNPPNPPGQWQRLSARWDWPRRARQWDIALLIESGKATAIRISHILDRVTSRLLEAVDRLECEPVDFGDVLDGLKVLCALVSPHGLERLGSEHRQGAIRE